MISDIDTTIMVQRNVKLSKNQFHMKIAVDAHSSRISSPKHASKYTIRMQTKSRKKDRQWKRTNKYNKYNVISM
jgi:hypothetical protein